MESDLKTLWKAGSRRGRSHADLCLGDRIQWLVLLHSPTCLSDPSADALTLGKDAVAVGGSYLVVFLLTSLSKTYAAAPRGVFTPSAIVRAHASRTVATSLR